MGWDADLARKERRFSLDVWYVTTFMTSNIAITCDKSLHDIMYHVFVTLLTYKLRLGINHRYIVDSIIITPLL
jgi:hypothetical protein